MSEPSKTTRYALIEERVLDDGQTEMVSATRHITSYKIDHGIILLEGSDFTAVIAPCPGHTYTITEDEE